MAAQETGDVVDGIVDQWRLLRPDLDVSPIGVIGRISRLSRLIDRRLGENFATFGIEDWMYDVLATLYRRGAPHELSAGDLVRQTMVTTGAITNRVDRLESRGLVERVGAADRRKVIVRLTPDGLAMVERVAKAHLDTERMILAALGESELERLRASLRRLLIELGDVPEPN